MVDEIGPKPILANKVKDRRTFTGTILQIFPLILRQRLCQLEENLHIYLGNNLQFILMQF